MGSKASIMFLLVLLIRQLIHTSVLSLSLHTAKFNKRSSQCSDEADHPIEDYSTAPKHTGWLKLCFDLTEHPIEDPHLDHNTLHCLHIL